MAGLRWHSTEQGIDDVEAFFEYAGYKARDMRDPLRKSADYIDSTIAGQFLTEGALKSGGWKPLSDKYEKWKVAHSPDPILQLGIELLHGSPGTPRDRKIMDALLDPDAWTITREHALYEPRSTRAVWHQEGRPERSRGGALPARPPLDLHEDDYEVIEEIFHAWLDDLRFANPQRYRPASLPSIFS